MLKRLIPTAKGVYARINDHHLTLVAGGVAFFAFLSVFPAIATTISLYGLVADAGTVQENIDAITGFIPAEVKELLFSRMRDVASEQNSTLTWGLVVGILVSLWSANKAMKAVAKGLNITYEKKEDRGFLKINIVTLALTIVTSLVSILVIVIAVVLPIVVNYFLSQGTAQVLTLVLSWVLLVAVLMGLFLLLYRYAPARDRRPHIKDSMPGALFSTTLIIVGSIAFSFYVKNFGTFDEEYGAIAAVVITLLWLYLGSLIFLIGAEFNGEGQALSSDKNTGKSEVNKHD